VKRLTISFLALLFFVSSPFAQQSKRIPAGIRQADKAEDQFEKGIEPPQNLPRRKPQELQQYADELAQLAQSIPPDVERANRGILPKDLTEKLKKIEKLSKRLRSQLEQ
jgi:predicted PurR-regulated permease PerM